MLRTEAIGNLERQIADLKQQLTALRRQAEPETVEDYALTGPDGQSVRLSELFGDKRDLILIHNMGKGCSYCTMWADGFNGVLPHLEDRAAFVLVSPDAPDVQQEFARERGWTFPIYSAHGTRFIEEMGFRDEDGWLPGVSTFRKTDGGGVQRVATTEFGPGDDFCAVWHFFDLLSGGAGGWEPRYSY